MSLFAVGSGRLGAGDAVTVKSLDEIMATLDRDGCLEGLPFMPEMSRFCGRSFRVRKRAHKTCDTLFGVGGRRVMTPAVHLDDLRCDGAAHGGCQAACLLFWHEAWLAPRSEERRVDAQVVPDGVEATLAGWCQRADPAGSAVRVFACQATAVPRFTTPLSAFDPRQYVEDVSSKNVRMVDLFWGGFHAFFRRLLHAGIAYRYVVKIYNWVQALRGEPPNPYVSGELEHTPVATLNLEPGEWVRIKSFADIVATLDPRNKNRGLWFIPQEMGRYCGRVARVMKRVDRFIDEKTGRMISARTASVILENVYCTGATIEKRMYCPRASALFWREIWLERVPAPEELQQPALERQSG